MDRGHGIIHRLKSLQYRLDAVRRFPQVLALRYSEVRIDMGKKYEQKIPRFDGGMTRFDGGMTNDSRSDVIGVARMIQHYDNYSLPSKLTPHRNMELDAVTESTLDTY